MFNENDSTVAHKDHRTCHSILRDYITTILYSILLNTFSPTNNSVHSSWVFHVHECITEQTKQKTV